MKSLRIVGIILAVNLMLVSAAWGQNLKKHLSMGNQLYKKGDITGAVTQYRKVVDILKKGKNPAGAQQIQMNIGIIYLKQKQYVKAVEELEAALALYKKPDKKLDLKLKKTLATAHYKAGNYALRANILEGLLKKYKKLDNKTRADILAELGDSYRRNEIYSKAIDYYQQSLKYYNKLKDTRSQALILTVMGQSQSKLGDFDASIKSLDAALPLSKKLGNHQGIAESYSNLGIVYWDLGEYPKALEYLAKAKKVESKENLKRNLGADYNNEGLVYKSAGNYPKAIGAIDTSIKIAREIKDEKSEAIALSNHALVKRILGKNEDAMKDYQAALKIYQRVKFKEGTASCYLGLGKLYEVDRLDYQKAYEYYQKALKIYRQLGNIAYQAEALNQIGRVLKKGIDRKRTTRDLIFEDDGPVFIEMPPSKAKAESLKAYREALKLATKVGKKEAIWSAQQGIGYALKTQGKEKESFKYYEDAIATVISIRGSDSDSELMGDYLKDKEDLFTEAIEVASALYAKTKDKKYLESQMEYQEIYKNEVMKNALMTAKPLFEDPSKAKLFTALTQTLTKKKKLDEANSRLINAQSKQGAGKTKTEQAEQAKKKLEIKQEAEKVKAKSRKLEGSFKKLLAKWKKQYPNDIEIFSSAAKVDLNMLQKNIKSDEAIIQYFPLSEKLIIICITSDGVTVAEVPKSYKYFAELIRDKFMSDNIEIAGRYNADTSQTSEKYYFDEANAILHELYNLLIAPVEASIENKSKLVFIPSKYLSYIPFSALVQGFDENRQPRFLVYDKTVSSIRLSFFKGAKASSNNLPGEKDIIAIGNPYHKDLRPLSPRLKGAEMEVTALSDIFKKRPPIILIGEAATESKWKDLISEKSFEIFYFATHGVPFGEVLWGNNYAKTLIKKFEKDDNQKNIDALNRYLAFTKKTFTSKSPLFGYLYMSYTGKEKDDGVLTLKEILELPEPYFARAKVAILSACNTAVTYSPKVSKDIRKELEKDSVAKELVSSGWSPGVDQICLTDTFMKRKFDCVMGTLWFADDNATAFIMRRFVENLKQDSGPEALRKAQLEYLRKTPSEFESLGLDYTTIPKHPFYWACGAIFGR